MQADRDGTLLPSQRTEMQALQQLAGIRDDAPMRLVRAWADTGWETTTPQRSRVSGRQRMLETLAMKYPRQPMSGREVVLQTLALRWPKTARTSRQKLIETLGNRWGHNE
jgi:hypothetical protein